MKEILAKVCDNMIKSGQLCCTSCSAPSKFQINSVDYPFTFVCEFCKRPSAFQGNPSADLHKGASSDPVDHPAHYHPGTYEAINVIEAWQLGFCLGNAVKYISRAGHKPSPSQTKEEKYIEDLEKSIWYLRRDIERTKKSVCK